MTKTIPYLAYLGSASRFPNRVTKPVWTLKDFFSRLRRREDGAELIEFVGTFPLVLLTVMIIWQFMLVGYTAIIVASAAREGARAMAVGEACQGAVVRASPSWNDSTRQMDCRRRGEQVIVTVRLQVPKTHLPLIGTLPGYPWVPSTAVMRYEPPY